MDGSAGANVQDSCGEPRSRESGTHSGFFIITFLLKLSAEDTPPETCGSPPKSHLKVLPLPSAPSDMNLSKGRSIAKKASQGCPGSIGLKIVTIFGKCVRIPCGCFS